MTTAARIEGSPVRAPAAKTAASSAHGLRRLATSGLFWGACVSVLVAAWVLLGLDGLGYYRTPLTVRGYEPGHPLLRPSGPAGQSFGVLGALLLLVPFAYMARKRVRWLKSAGSPAMWLEIHLFCGIVGPVLITLHTSFKFNGIVSAAYWSMVVVMSSGFVGRYLYVRIPRSIRGTELTRADLDDQAAALADDLGRLTASDRAMAAVRACDAAVVPAQARQSFANLLFGEVTMGRHLRALDRELEAGGVDPDLRSSIVSVTAERSTLRRRAAYLEKTKQLFDLWHVFHLPLVYILLIIAAAHVAIVVYLGYVPFRWE